MQGPTFQMATKMAEVREVTEVVQRLAYRGAAPANLGSKLANAVFMFLVTTFKNFGHVSLKNIFGSNKLF